MSQADPAHQISLTEWFEQMNHSEREAIRQEDVHKRERLKILKDVIGLPFDQPTTFEAIDLTSFASDFEEFLSKKSQDRCALRLNPKDPSLPKMRIKGESIAHAYEWFKQQNIDPTKYKVDIMPFPKVSNWSATFVVNSQGIFGEIIKGARTQLAWGEYGDNRPIPFSYDFKKLTLGSPNTQAEEQIRKFLVRIKVKDKSHQSQLKEVLSSEFHNDYLLGYFEATESDEFGLWFVDYNRILGRMYSHFTPISPTKNPSPTAQVTGRVGNPGKVTGKVRIIPITQATSAHIDSDEVLVCTATTPDFVGLMSKACAIVTDQGGILSHASVIARELNKPCIVATGNATQVLKDGDLIEVDAHQGLITLISN